MWAASPVQTQTGSYFIYRNTVGAAYSRWVLSFTVDLKLHKSHLARLTDELSTFTQLVVDFELWLDKTFNQSTEHEMPNIYQVKVLLNQQLEQFANELSEIQYQFKIVSGLTSSAPRQRRALLPFIAPVLSSLFGVASQDNVRSIHKAMNSLKESQTKIISAYEVGWTLLNKTSEAVRINRQQINTISTAVNQLSGRLNEFYTRVSKQIYPLTHSLALNSFLHEAYHLINTALRETHFGMITLSQQIVDTMQGSLPISLITPKQLGKILRGIQLKLPPDVCLPYPVSSHQLNSYYQLLHPMLVPGPSRFRIHMNLPLVTCEKQFDIYQAVTVPIPQTHLGLAAEYKLESNAVAISADKSQYVLLPDDVASSCIHLPFCYFSYPISDIRSSSCIVALLLKDARQISTNCKKTITKLDPLPVVKHLITDHWLLSSGITYELSIYCGDNGDEVSKVKTVGNGSEIIAVGENCYAKSPYYTLPRILAGYDEFEMQVKTLEDVHLGSLLPNIWQTDDIEKHQNLTLSQPLKMLTSIEALPLDHLSAMLSAARQPLNEISLEESSSNWLVYVVLGVFIVIIILLLVGYLVCKGRLIKCFRKVPDKEKPNVEPLLLELTTIKECKTEGGDVNGDDQGVTQSTDSPTLTRDGESQTPRMAIRN